MDAKIRYPFGAADSQSAAYAATIAATIDNAETVLTIAQMTGAATLNLTLNKDLPVGSVLNIKVSADGTNRALTPGTGMTGTAQTITASKNFLLVYKFDGSKFLHQSTQQLD